MKNICSTNKILKVNSDNYSTLSSDGTEVSEEDAYGGRELISKGTINITVSRNKNAEDWVERNTTKLTIRKSRTDQVTGVHALLFYRAKMLVDTPDW